MTQEIFKQLQEKFPSKAYKQVTFGRGFTSLDAYYIVERMTDVFGLCGQGWGFKGLEFGHEGKSAYCIGTVWYKKDELIGEIQAVGDAAIVNGNLAEAYKKAQTNLLSKASSFIGVGLDVYKGEHQDDPYLDRQASKTSEAQRDRVPPPKPSPAPDMPPPPPEDYDEYNIFGDDPEPEPVAEEYYTYKPPYPRKDEFKEAAFKAGAYAKWDGVGKQWVCKALVPGFDEFRV